MKKVKFIFIIFAIMLVVSCGNDSHKNYIGGYEYNSIVDGNPRIMQIYKEGNIFFIKDDNKDPIPAETVNEGLKVNGILISLSKDKNTLYFSGNKARRVSNDYINNFFNKKKLEKELCEKLNKESEMKNKEITDKDTWNKYVDELLKRKPKNCILLHSGKRFF